MLVSMGSILERANRENYGVLAINVFNLESSYLTIKAAEEMHAPIILDLLMQHICKQICQWKLSSQQSAV